MTGLGPSSRANARDLRKISPFGRNDINSELSVLAGGISESEELSALWKFKVGRFRIIYELDRKARIIRIFAIGHRREVYEKLANRLRQVVRNK